MGWCRDRLAEKLMGTNRLWQILLLAVVLLGVNSTIRFSVALRHSKSFRAGLLLMLALMLITGSPLRSTYAVFTGATGNLATFSTAALTAPGDLTALPAGHDIQLNWNAGQNGNGYTILGTANGTSNLCPASSSSSYLNIASTSATSYADTNRAAPEGTGPQGTWYCYQVRTNYATWTSVQNNPVVAAQVGFVASSVRLIDGGNPGELDAGDQVVLTFNQPVDPLTGPASIDAVCVDSNSTILLGSTSAAGSCSSIAALHLGILSGGTITNTNTGFPATYTWGNGNQALTVTLGTRSWGLANPLIDPAVWTFTPTTDTTRLLSASGNLHICDSNAGGGNCLPQTSLTQPLSVARSAPVKPTSKSTATATATRTATLTATTTATLPSTATLTPVPSVSASPTATMTPTPAPSATSTPLPATTATPTVYNTPTVTNTPPALPTTTPVATIMQATATPTALYNSTTPVATVTPTPVGTTGTCATATPIPTATNTPSPTVTPAATVTSSASPVPTGTATQKVSPPSASPTIVPGN